MDFGRLLVGFRGAASRRPEEFVSPRGAAVRPRRQLAKIRLCAPAAVVILLASCGSGTNRTSGTPTASPLDPCSVLPASVSPAVLDEQLTRVDGQSRVNALTRGVYGYRCKWVSTTTAAYVEVIVVPSPAGKRIYRAAIDIPAGEHVSPRPGTTTIIGVPGVVITLPGETEFLAGDDLVEVAVKSGQGQTLDDDVARTLTPLIARNIASLARPR